MYKFLCFWVSLVRLCWFRFPLHVMGEHICVNLFYDFKCLINERVSMLNKFRSHSGIYLSLPLVHWWWFKYCICLFFLLIYIVFDFPLVWVCVLPFVPSRTYLSFWCHGAFKESRIQMMNRWFWWFCTPLNKPAMSAYRCLRTTNSWFVGAQPERQYLVSFWYAYCFLMFSWRQTHTARNQPS